MNLERSQEELELAASVRSTLASLFRYIDDASRVAQFQLDGLDREAWRMASSLGWTSMELADDFGGVGLDFASQLLAFVEMGSGLAPTNVLPASVSALALHATGSLEQVPEIVSGEAIVGTVVGDLVVDAAEGDFAVRSGPQGFELVHLDSTSPALPADDLTTLAELGGFSTVASLEMSNVAERWQVLVAAMSVGVADRALEMSVEYAKVREQFGRPIGSFQAVKHRCAEMASRAYIARVQMLSAGVAVGAKSADSRDQARAALLLAQRAAQQNAADNIQNHGAIGFSTEHRAGQLAKRANTWTQIGSLADPAPSSPVGVDAADLVGSDPNTLGWRS